MMTTNGKERDISFPRPYTDHIHILLFFYSQKTFSYTSFLKAFDVFVYLYSSTSNVIISNIFFFLYNPYLSLFMNYLDISKHLCQITRTLIIARRGSKHNTYTSITLYNSLNKLIWLESIYS